MTILFNLMSVLASGFLSFVIARHVKPQAHLTISLDPYMDLTAKLLGGGFSFKKNGKALTNVKVLKLTITTGRFSGVGVDNFHSKFKPCIKFHNFRIVGLNTLNNDRTQFDIPLGKTSENTLVININWIKRKSKAVFIVVGHAQTGVLETDVKATLFPGLSQNVSVSHGGSLIQGINRMNFESEKIEELHDSL